MSRLTRLAAGAAMAATRPTARLCWHRSTKRLLLWAMRRHSCGGRSARHPCHIGSLEYQMSHQSQEAARASPELQICNSTSHDEARLRCAALLPSPEEMWDPGSGAQMSAPSSSS